MENMECDSSPLQDQLTATMRDIRDDLNASIDIVNEENNCLLCKLEDIKKKCLTMEAIASSFYLECYLSAYTDKYSEIARCTLHLSQNNHGALIVIERENSLEGLIQKGISLGAQLTAPLLESIFYPGNPLHDGAVLVHGNTIISAANVLPLTAQNITGKKLGTRHRAALGLSEISDALVLVVSEETGRVSFALEGALYPITNVTSLQ
ncbi:sporulation-specific diadenylate cyclase CdaS [Peribacillus sp. SCS-155]|uniref:sporulation-specific diadenylate cyclase CdaS n=1 Tax=Peribacillus sedimenti TaxID=3115297 RepID=UPI003906CC16